MDIGVAVACVFAWMYGMGGEGVVTDDDGVVMPRRLGQIRVLACALDEEGSGMWRGRGSEGKRWAGSRGARWGGGRVRDAAE